MIDVDTGLVEDLELEVGESLRSVAIYNRDGYEFEYLRGDIENAYSEDEIQDVYEGLVIQGMTREFLEQLFHAGPPPVWNVWIRKGGDVPFHR